MLSDIFLPSVSSMVLCAAELLLFCHLAIAEGNATGGADLLAGHAFGSLNYPLLYHCTYSSDTLSCEKLSGNAVSAAGTLECVAHGKMLSAEEVCCVNKLTSRLKQNY